MLTGTAARRGTRIASHGQGRQAQQLRLAHIRRMFDTALVDRIHLRGVADVDDELAQRVDVGAGVLAPSRLAADVDAQHGRLVGNEGEAGERREVDHAGVGKRRDPGDRSRHDDAAQQPVGCFGVERVGEEWHGGASRAVEAPIVDSGRCGAHRCDRDPMTVAAWT